jgi:hypothetical protein
MYHTICSLLAGSFFNRPGDRFNWIPSNQFRALNEIYYGHRTQMPFQSQG